MALDEYLFGKFIRYFKTKKPDESIQNRTVKLDVVQQRLTLLGRAISGQAISIYPAVKEGGFKGNSFFLPQQFNFFANYEQNLSFYFFRILYLCIQQKLQLNWYEKASLSDEDSIQLAKENSTKVLAVLFEEYPAVQTLFDALITTQNPENKINLDTSWLYGKYMQDEISENNDNALDHKENLLKHLEVSSPKTILKAKAVEEIVNLTIDTKQQEDYVMTHNFEKVDTADEFSGSWRDFDGEDELEDHQDALDELTMKFTVRTNEVSHSVYQSEFTENANIAESSGNDSDKYFVLYDEWDYSKNQYKKDYTKVFPDVYSKLSETYYTETISKYQTLLVQLRKLLANISNRRTEQRFQTYGKDIDIDAATDRFVDIVSKQTPTERVYINDKKTEKDLSILLLMDISLSSDSYADGNRVIDVAKQTTILFGEILNDYNIDFSVQCFYSQTRNHSSYITVKSFDEKWQKAKYKIGSIQPIGYTRIGAALRHSGALLHQRDNKNKWIILLSDGKPNDYDRYEGNYGIHDVKQALRELNQNQINSYALAIESTAKFYLPQMFGQNHYQIVSSPNELIHSMVQLYEKLRFS